MGKGDVNPGRAFIATIIVLIGAALAMVGGFKFRDTKIGNALIMVGYAILGFGVATMLFYAMN